MTEAQRQAFAGLSSLICNEEGIILTFEGSLENRLPDLASKMLLVGCPAPLSLVFAAIFLVH